MSSWVIGVDPGAEHTGLALFAWGVEARCVETATLKPWPAMDKLCSWLTDHTPVLTVVYEEFRLYDDKPLVWDDMATVEAIGALRWICRGFGVSTFRQGASIKKPTSGLMRHLGLRCTGQSGHARDAELHAWRWLLREGQYLTARQPVQ
jgi:hypothetical protein